MKIYAMKILKKERVLQRKQYEHTLSERRILESIDHPFIVSLRFAFQTEHKLYMVFGTWQGCCCWSGPLFPLRGTWRCVCVCVGVRACVCVC